MAANVKTLRGMGRKQRISTLAPTTRKILEITLKEEEYIQQPLADDYINQLLGMINNEDPTLERYALDELEQQTRETPPETPDKAVLSILDLLDPWNDENYNLVKTLNNIIIHTNQETRAMIKEKTIQVLDRIKTQDQRTRREILTINRKLEPMETYNMLIKRYHQAIQETPENTHIIRNKLLEKHRDKIKEIRLELLKGIKQGEKTERYVDELTQLPPR